MQKGQGGGNDDENFNQSLQTKDFPEKNEHHTAPETQNNDRNLDQNRQLKIHKKNKVK